jgi:MoxR-vWA-beta-propeller ternary system domain bpX4
LAARGLAGNLLEIQVLVLPRFLQSLHDSGRAELAPGSRDLAAALRAAGKDPGELRKIENMLENWHADAVMDLPGPALAFHPEAAVWGAILLFQAACLATFRDMGETEIHELLQRDPLPDGSNPAAHFSADLCLRHWPDLYRMARARSEDDPLVKVMHGLAAMFPLSSLGMNLPAANSQLPLHLGLRQFFAERALERADHEGLADPETNTLIRLKLGAYAATLGCGLLPTTPES